MSLEPTGASIQNLEDAIELLTDELRDNPAVRHDNFLIEPVLKMLSAELGTCQKNSWLVPYELRPLVRAILDA